MQDSLHGIHHITAISSDPQANIDFYTGLLGLRLIKLTVNYDDPGVYHLYFSDSNGSPGTVLTFFPFPDAMAGSVGNGQVSAIGYSISPASVDFWVDRFSRRGIKFDGPIKRFDDDVISFSDNDGLPLELVADNHVGGNPWTQSSIPPEHAISRFSSTALAVSDAGPTTELLTGILGFEKADTEGNRTRFFAGRGDSRQMIDIIADPRGKRGKPGPGTVHHIAWRCFDSDQESWRKEVARAGYNVTSIIDRNYFHSIYFRERGGVLFEIASDEPGFSVDQQEAELGTRLVLPPWLESKRESIERHLPPLKLAHPVSSSRSL